MAWSDVCDWAPHGLLSLLALLGLLRALPPLLGELAVHLFGAWRLGARLRAFGPWAGGVISCLTFIVSCRTS